MPLPIRAAYNEGSGLPAVKHYPLASGTIVRGALMKLNTNNTIVEITGPTDISNTILGVAKAANASAFGYDMGDSPTVVTGRADTIPLDLANRDTVFVGQIVSAANTPVVPAVADVGVAYGVVKNSDNTWSVNRSNTTNLTVRVLGIVPPGEQSSDPFGFVYFKFLAAATTT
jgi:hypothetical protein